MQEAIVQEGIVQEGIVQEGIVQVGIVQVDVPRPLGCTPVPLLGARFSWWMTHASCLAVLLWTG